MNQKNGRTDPGPLRERARSLFISQATIDETLDIFSDHHQGWFADGAIDDSKVKDFKYQVIITDH